MTKIKSVDLLKQNQELKLENQRLKDEINKLKHEYGLLNPTQESFNTKSDIIQISNQKALSKFSSSSEKIDLYMSLFKGRDDVCAKRWKNNRGYSPFCENDFKAGLCFKPKVKCINCNNSCFVSLNKLQIEKHLMGEYVLGLYPLTKNDTCFILAIDFDKTSWKEDVKAVREVCKECGISAYVERSQSGNGCHLWFFFENEIKASLARKFAFRILDFSMQKCSSLGFDSFDRLFPSQILYKKMVLEILLPYLYKRMLATLIILCL